MINGTAGWRHPARRSFPWPRSPLATASTSLALERGAPSARHRTAGATRCKKVRTMLNPSYLPVQLTDELFVVVCSFSPLDESSPLSTSLVVIVRPFLSLCLSLSSFANSMAIRFENPWRGSRSRTETRFRACVALSYFVDFIFHQQFKFASTLIEVPSRKGTLLRIDSWRKYTWLPFDEIMETLSTSRVDTNCCRGRERERNKKGKESKKKKEKRKRSGKKACRRS